MDIGHTISVFHWRSLLRAFGAIAGLLLLAGLVMGFILLVANIFNQNSQAHPMAVFVDITTPPPAIHARPHAPVPHNLDGLSNSPGRPMSVGFKSGMDRRAHGSSGYGSNVNGEWGNATAPVPAPAVNQRVGLTVDQYRQTVDSGKKVYLPNPRGECVLDGQGDRGLISALDTCFAARAAY